MKIKRNNKLPWRVIDDTVYIVNPASSYLYSLNPLGRRIWDLISKPVTLEFIIDKLYSEYDVDKETLKDDIEEFFRIMGTHHLIAN
ncbi:MAG: hypothetical protein AUJ85_06295 [Elusimicrobia bacterium CG1_02_37_114]|nr:MAG: hypothetical protein AUJ85_06295 [Elusimicrobia bacterium CG1_02_37_114]PIV53266.1 MAG: hypothetical protein COS17_04740 [Elusimicrobia bacterium CG02_land_8_20_14_3_00_37_13]PIZ13588.1 MAG: hypothetical protein COY53_03960 [Elusimicrobia bacterium CG_4_10_14_0_8_um_filter_37_32]